MRKLKVDNWRFKLAKLTRFLDINPSVKIGTDVQVWHFSTIRDNCSIGDGSMLGRYVYLGQGIEIGKYTRIQDRATIYPPCVIGDHVFVGPGSFFINDKHPEIREHKGKVKNFVLSKVAPTVIEDNVTIGANVTIFPSLRIGQGAFIAAGSVVTRNVPAMTMVVGVPARIVGKRQSLDVPFDQSTKKVNLNK